MDSNLQNKLHHFEANPPEEVWNKIADALDAEESFPQRLFTYEAQPPVKAWTVIEASLDQAMPLVKVIPIYTRYKKPLRYIAAASVIAIVLAITNLSSNRLNNNTTQAATESVVPLQQSSLIPVPKKQVLIEEPAPMPTDPVVTATRTEKHDKANRKGATSKRTLGFIDSQNAINGVSLTGKFIPSDVIKEQLFDHALLDSYMVFSDGNGTAMKLPKKLFSLVNCKDGDGSCQERLHQLRQKLSANTVPTDFASLLEIVRQLQ